MKEIILAKYGEIILKGGNRPKFENILMNNIRNSLKNVAEVKARLAQATIYVEVFDEDKMDIVVDRLSKIFGIVSITRAVVCERKTLRTALNLRLRQSVLISSSRLTHLKFVWKSAVILTTNIRI